MSEKKKPQVGEWWRTRDGEIRHVVAFTFVGDYPVIAISRYGTPSSYTVDGIRTINTHPSAIGVLDLIEHLPDCTGFDWKPEPPPKQTRTVILKRFVVWDFVGCEYEFWWSHKPEYRNVVDTGDTREVEVPL